ncbi:MAG: CIA30 family protein [Planctomycetota bacterium]
MRTNLLITVLVLALPFFLPAAELVLDNADNAPGWNQTGGGSTVTAASTHQEGTGAVHIALASANWTWSQTAGFYLGAPVSGAVWNSYEGIRFWVKGDGSTDYGIMSIIYNASYYRYYAAFPMQNGVWTEVTIPWREFTQRMMQGRMEDHLAEIHTVQFTHANCIDTGYPSLVAVPAVSYDIDNVRLVNGLTLAATPVPAATSIDNIVAKLKAKKPVTIGWIGASVSWGLKCTDPVTQNSAAVLKGLLVTAYGYSVPGDITIVNKSVGGSSSFSGICNLGRYLGASEPLDLVVFGEYAYNDAGGDVSTGRLDQIEDNHEKIFGTLLRRNNTDVLYFLSGLHVTTGGTNTMDPLLPASGRPATA